MGDLMTTQTDFVFESRTKGPFSPDQVFNQKAHILHRGCVFLTFAGKETHYAHFVNKNK
jgi:hypothetical protein